MMTGSRHLGEETDVKAWLQRAMIWKTYTHDLYRYTCRLRGGSSASKDDGRIGLVGRPEKGGMEEKSRVEARAGRAGGRARRSDTTGGGETI